MFSIVYLSWGIWYCVLGMGRLVWDIMHEVVGMLYLVFVFVYVYVYVYVYIV